MEIEITLKNKAEISKKISKVLKFKSREFTAHSSQLFQLPPFSRGQGRRRKEAKSQSK